MQPANRAPAGEPHVRLDSLLQARNREAGAATNIIVEFKDEPMFIARARPGAFGKVASQAAYESRFAQFTADAQAISRSLPGFLADHVGVHREFFRAFFGVSTTVPSWMLPVIQNLPYVKAVHFDREVHALIDPGVVMIGAPAVWSAYGTKGGGVRVGIIDTGIDYMHPALGGGFGAGFKVAGGYDFVNNDPDPMDDNGHGTHVAGIVAADGDSVEGVAPGATLYAYKALNAQGNGLESDIIAAIERAVDPDQDGDPSDRLDVVNMSLGTNGGSPTDPSSIAVDNAVQSGIVFCVAAGNSGGPTPVEGKENNFFYDGSASIGSPGTAELAITVGASDGTDNPASFSSKGPNRVSFSIKPEVMAPGVNISSTYLGSGYATLSGTSMATPMVSGVAALVRSVHPAWGTVQVKSAIVNSAKSLGAGPFIQGGGRVQALQAVSARTLVVPSTLSYGMDDPSAGTWTRQDTLYVANKSSSPQSYVVAAGGTIPGVTLDVAPSLFSVPANDSVMVIATLSVNNAQVTIEEENILRYGGTVAFNGTLDTARVPWAFSRTSRLVVTTSEPNAFFFGFTSSATLFSTEKRVNWTSPTRAEVFAPDKGVYEFVTLFRNPAGKSKLVITEGIAINNNDARASLDGAQAVFPLVYHGLDHAGNPLKGYSNPVRTLIATFPNFGDWPISFLGGSDTLLLSAASAAHSFRPIEFQVDLARTGTFHIVQYDRFAAMNGPKLLTNTPSVYIPEHFRIRVPPGAQRAVNGTFVSTYTNTNGTDGFGGIGIIADTVAVVNGEYAFTGYFGRSSSPTEDAAVEFFTSYSDLQRLPLDMQSTYIMPYADSIAASPRTLVTPAIPRFESGSTMTMGGAPVHLMMLWYNNSFGANTLHFNTVFRGMLNETRYIDAAGGTYSLFDRNGVKLFTKSLGDSRGPLALTADRYRVVVSSANAWLRNTPSVVTLTSEFNLGNGFNANPPSITSLTLLDGRRHPSDSFAKGDRPTLQFSFIDLGSQSNLLPRFDSTRAWYRKYGTLVWKPLNLTKVIDVRDNEGTIVSADLGAATLEDSIAVDLRMATVDSNGFTTDYVVSPAFAVGNWDGSGATGVEPPDNQNTPGQFTLEQNYPNPFNPATTIRYGLPRSAHVSLTLFNILGQKVATLVDEQQEGGTYSVRFDGTGCASGVYFYRLQAGGYVKTKRLLILR
ncbi:MAG TPA: S8 family serine peptidase [Bacteroidota bacterium]|nr:S8 family serine peptidase [Bacteroidota bacterium]